jgi:hypothetical protein
LQMFSGVQDVSEITVILGQLLDIRDETFHVNLLLVVIEDRVVVAVVDDSTKLSQRAV